MIIKIQLNKDNYNQKLNIKKAKRKFYVFLTIKTNTMEVTNIIKL